MADQIYRVSFLLDVSQLAPQAAGDADAVLAYVVEALINPARKVAKDRLHDARRNTDTADDKTRAMSEQVRAMMMTMMVEANLTVECMPPATVLSTEMPFERDVDPTL